MSQHVRAAGDRRRPQGLLDERLRFETMLSRLSTTFINLPTDQIDGQIERGLQQIVEFLGIDRSSLGQFSEDGSELLITHSYTVPGLPPVPRLDIAPLLPWYTGKLRRGEVMRFRRMPDDLPPEADLERESYVRSGVRSHLGLPFKVGESVLGGISFGSLRGERDWPDDLVQSLQLVCEIFANALARKHADLARQESEARLRFLLESTHAIPWVADAQSFLFTYVGPQADTLLGYPADDWFGKDFWTDHIHPDDRETALAFCLEHSQTHADYAFDYRMIAADGRIVWIHDVVNVVAENGTPRILRGFMIDVTARRHAEEETRTLREQVAHVGRVTAMGEMAASIAHEVNQPLCAIVSNAQALQRMVAGGGFDGGEVDGALRDIIKDGQRASAVLARIRGFLRKAPAERARVEVNDLIREVTALTHQDMARRGVAVKLDLAAELPPVYGDRVQLQQVLLNLLTNGADALKRTPKELRQLVVRSVAGEAGSIVVAVQDSGSGLAAADLARVFEAFFTTKPGSLGMGLAICKSTVEAHGGRITVRPNDGAGTIFQFTLPGLSFLW